MSSIIRCVYSSMASATFQESEIPRILEKSREKNARAGLTGMLLYLEGTFFQVLEGEPGHVDPLYELIKADPRHSRVTQIIWEPIARRDFGEWTMGFQTVSLLDLGELTGENDFFKARTCFEQLNPGRARKLLTAFANGRWNPATTGMHRQHARVG